MRGWTALAILGLLAGCSGRDAPADNGDDRIPEAPPVAEGKFDGPDAATTSVMLDAGGLRFTAKDGATTLLAFGVPRADAEKALKRVTGEADDDSRNEECGAGPMDFTRFDAITLNFQDGKFVGWFLSDEPGANHFRTAEGIVVGNTRAQAAKAASLVMAADSTLGEEFSIGTGDPSIGGIFAAPGDAAKVDALFAGTNCFFR